MNPYITAVNQKLFFSRLLLDKCLPESDSYGHAEKAVTEAALFQLVLAYRFHLQTIAHNYSINAPDDINNATQLYAELKFIDKHPAEAVELCDLEQAEDSWLYNMLLAYKVLNCASTEGVSDNNPRSGTIPLFELETANQPLSSVLIQEWLSKLDEMVNRHREMLLEC